MKWDEERTGDALSPDNLTYDAVSLGLLSADRHVAKGANQKTVRHCFQWREITVPPGSIALQARGLTDCGLDRQALAGR